MIMTTMSNGVDTTEASRDLALVSASNHIYLAREIADPNHPFPFPGDAEQRRSHRESALNDLRRYNYLRKGKEMVDAQRQ
jgi:hypothetical protein